MVFTEKEKLIINALLEEELDCAMHYGNSSDSLIESYSQSLSTIMRKLNEKSFRTPKNKCFYFVSREHTTRQLA